MSEEETTLHLLVGKICAGKSTLAAALGRAPRTVVVSEDAWLSALFGDEMQTVADYVRCAAKLRAAMEPHLIALLRVGLSVVLDFPANTPATRGWMRGLFETAGCAHRLHFLDVTDDICKLRLQQRNAEGTHAFTVSEEEFDRISSHFVAPSDDEGFEILVYPGTRSLPKAD